MKILKHIYLLYNKVIYHNNNLSNILNICLLYLMIININWMKEHKKYYKKNSEP